MARLMAWSVEGIGEIVPGQQLGDIIVEACSGEPNGPLRDNDVLVVTQKIVSKAEGRLVEIDPNDPLSHKILVEQEAVRIVRRRGDLIITETKPCFVSDIIIPFFARKICIDSFNISSITCGSLSCSFAILIAFVEGLMRARSTICPSAFDTILCVTTRISPFWISIWLSAIASRITALRSLYSLMSSEIRIEVICINCSD